MTHRVGRGTAVLFHDRGTRRGWVVSLTPPQHFTPRKDPTPILQEAGWVPGPVWTGVKSRPHRDSIPDHPTRSQSLYRLSYLTHILIWQFYIFHSKFSSQSLLITLLFIYLRHCFLLPFSLIFPKADTATRHSMLSFPGWVPTLN